MAENYLKDAGIILEEARQAREKGLHHRAIRLSQEACELALKACLRAVGIEYPKAHDLSDILLENRERFPGWFRCIVDELAEASSWLAERRGPAMYGDEVGGRPPSALFDEADSAKALSYASRCVKAAGRLLEEFYR